MKVSLYARVSTKDKEQNPETQLKPMREYCKQRDYEIVEPPYIDYESGRNTERKDLNRLRKDALHRKMDMVLVWKMDRLSRGGIRETFKQIDYFKQYKIPVVSLTEPYLSTDQPTSDLILAILSWAAQQESKNISVRVKAGIERYQSEHNGQWGRKPTVTYEQVANLRKQGMGYHRIAKQLGVSVSWVHKLFTKPHKKLSSEKTS